VSKPGRPTLDGVDHRREAAGLHANDLYARLELARRGGDAADEPAAAHRDDQRVEVGLGAQHLQADGALASDHGFVVEGVDEAQALARCEHQRVVAGLVEVVAMQHDLGAEAARAFHLHHRGRHRHHDDGTQAQALRVVGQALGVVAGRRGDDATDRLAAIDHRGQLVQRAAFLERGRELQVLELQEDLRADDLAQRAALDAGRVQHLAGQPRSGSLDVGERDGHVQAVPPTVSRSIRSVGWPTPTGTLWPSLPQTPTPVSSSRSLPIMLTRVIASGPLPTSVAPFTG